VRRDLSIDQLFDMATEATPEAQAAPVEKPDTVSAAPVVESAEAVEISELPVVSKVESNLESSLEQAEFFIKDLGVWDHYQKFLADK